MEPDSRWQVSPASAEASDIPDAVELTAPNPWRTIWFSPRRTIRQVLAAEPPLDWRPLFGVAFVASLLSVINQWLLIPDATYTDLARQCGVMLALWIGWATIGVRLETGYGRRRGGRGVTAQVRLAAVVSNIPMIALSVCWIPLWISTGGQGGKFLDPAQPLISNALALATDVGGWWAIVTSVITLAEVHRFSLWKAFQTLLLVGLILIVLYVFLMAALTPG